MERTLENIEVLSYYELRPASHKLIPVRALGAIAIKGAYGEVPFR